jgi:hypothetical protein
MSRAPAHIARAHDVFASYQRRQFHDRQWYCRRYPRIVVAQGAHYYWNAGYWYPAWGYDPDFQAYPYDAPIYSYANLPPDEIVITVQEQLEDEGFYNGEIDGRLDDQTRAAISGFQRAHGLELTSSVDEPTVEALGLGI